MFDEERNTKSFIGGLITGGVLGGLAGILFAPKSGKELRKDINNKKDEILDESDMMLENAKERAWDIISEAKKKATNLIDDARSKVDAMSAGAENFLEHGKETIENGITRIKDAVNAGTEAFNEEREKINDKMESQYNPDTKSKSK